MKLCLNDYNSADLIRIIREWTNLTQREFGKAIGKSEKTVRDYEAGRINYSIKTIFTIMNKFNITVTFEKKYKYSHK